MRTNFTNKRQTLIVVVATLMVASSPDRLHGFGAEFVAAQRNAAVRPGVCEREAPKLPGQKPVQVGRTVSAPKKLRDVTPKYPELPAGTTGSDMWIGEILINGAGRVAHVWPVREVQIKPPFPAFNNAIRDAIQQWTFEPLLIEGKPAPVCMTVTVNINWR